MSTNARRLAFLVSLFALCDCTPSLPAPIQRAAREFECPTEEIRAVERSDIERNVFDVNACGSLVRYACMGRGCAREPDPDVWDIDPAIAAATPVDLPLGELRRIPRICRDSDDRGCLARQADSFTWRPGESGALVQP